MRKSGRPKTDFELVRERLQWCKRIHVGKGLIGRESTINTMRQLIEFYRSDQWRSAPQTFRGISQDLLRVVNKIFPIANRQQAGVASRNPRVQYFPRREEDHKSAPFIEALHNYDIRSQNHILQLNAALRDHQFAPYPGVIRHGYTPPEELFDEKGRALTYYRPENANRPWIRRVAPWNVLIDPRAESFEMDGGAQWCAFRNVMTIDQIKRNPNMVARDQLDSFKGNISAPWQDMMPKELRTKEDPDRQGYVEVWSYYDFEDRSWSQLTLSGVDTWLRAPADWPIPWEWLPINCLIVNPQMDTPYPIALMQDCLPLQNELNQVRTMMSLLTRQTRRIGIYNTQAIDEVDATMLKDADLFEWFPIKQGNPQEAIFQTQVGGLPQELGMYAAQIVDDIRESTGLSRFGRAQRENVDTATEASAIVEGQDVIEARVQDAFDRFVTGVEETYMQGRRAILTSTGAEEVLRIVGPEGLGDVISYETIDAQKIAGQFEFEIVAGSTQPRDLDREAQKAAVDLQLAQALPYACPEQNYRDYLELRRKDPAKYMRPESAMASAVMGGAQVKQAAGPPGQGAPGAGMNIDPNMARLLTGQMGAPQPNGGGQQ